MAINSQQKPILIIPFILLLTIVANPLIKLSESAAPGTMFDLIHRNHLPVNQNQTLSERVKQLLHRDMIHVQMIQSNYHNKQQNNVGPTVDDRTLGDEKVAVSPIRSGFSDSVGEYFVEMMVGTPPKKFLLVAATASDLTWLDCNYKGINKSPPKVVFDADHSTSFKTIECSSTMCKNDLQALFSLPNQTCTHPKDGCHYDFGYGGTFAAAQGILAYETVTFNLLYGKTSAATNTLIGCTNSRRGLDSILGPTGASGIMGLSNSKFSLQNQVSNLFGHTFSYCLVAFESHKTKSSKLFFGSPPQGTIKINGPMQHTKLELVNAAPSYGVYIKNIYVNGKLIIIPASAWSFNSKGPGGTIIDSGSTSTSLIDSAYGPVINVLRSSLKSFKSVGGPFELCYATKGFDENAVPKMEIEFVGGARLGVAGKSYLLDSDDGSGKVIKCLTFSKGESLNIIGNLMQQNNLWEFDNKNGILSFGSSSCT